MRACFETWPQLCLGIQAVCLAFVDVSSHFGWSSDKASLPREFPRPLPSEMFSNLKQSLSALSAAIEAFRPATGSDEQHPRLPAKEMSELAMQKSENAGVPSGQSGVGQVSARPRGTGPDKDLGDACSLMDAIRNSPSRATQADGSALTTADDHLYVQKTKLMEGPYDTHWKFDKVLDAHPEIQWRRPKDKNGNEILNRLEVHIGDWLKFLAATKRASTVVTNPLDTRDPEPDAIEEIERAKARADEEKRSNRNEK
jgi:hypothetical protein